MSVGTLLLSTLSLMITARLAFLTSVLATLQKEFQWSYNAVTIQLQWSHNRATVELQLNYNGAAMELQWKKQYSYNRATVEL